MTQDLNRLYRLIGYRFNEPSILQQALTHKSKNKNNNERLEFLGDSILDCVISEALYYKFPKKNEGVLSVLRMYIVCGKTLTDMAKRFCLGEFMSFGVGEIKSGGHKRSRLLEDAFEALIGAIYIDSGFYNTKICILRWYKDKLESLDVEKHIKDPKSCLQEYLQASINMRPTYKIINITGKDHDQTFMVEVSLGVASQSYQAEGKSRKQAEHTAARIALAAINEKKEQWQKDEKVIP
jgi:ribonuclease-3